MSKAKVSLGVTVALFASLLLPVLVAAPAAAVAPQNIQSTLAGCKPNPASSYVVTAGPPASAICTVNGNYTTGNLGKSWNELDLVPFRLTMRQQGGNPPSPQTYQVAIVLDAEDGGAPGYDVISVPTKNTALSTGGAGNCAISATGDVDGTEANLGGGIDLKRYRILTITQTAGTTCVFDYYGRLAVGAHLFPGSSLHANLADENLGGGQADVSIPVNEISPQEIEKTMAASQDADHTWTVEKEATPAHLDFENVCDPAVPTSLNTQITITWDRLPADPSGVINIHTVVEATNPAARIIRVLVSDDLRSGTTVLETHTNGLGTLVPANAQGFNVLEYDTTVPAGTTDINDIATASYIDDLTGVPVPGQTEAVFPPFVGDPPVQQQLEIQDGTTTNATATITDTEAITGAGLSFSVAAPSVGSFTNYTAGDVVSPGGTVEWSSGSQSGGGSVTFDKTVYLDAAGGATSGTLDDTATVTGSDGFTVDADASVTIDSTLSGTLVINKETTIPVDGDTTFEFTLTGPNGSDVIPVTILDDGTLGSSTTITGLTGGNYNVEETNSKGFTPAPDQGFTIGAGSCDASLDFVNTFGPATATALKITAPTGFEADWKFTVTLDGNPFDTGTSDSAGNVQWDTAGSDTLTLGDEGTYTITETTQAGFVLDPITVNDNGNLSGTTDLATASCSFTVNYPADADGVFDCSFTNTKLGSIKIVKETVPSPDPTDTAFTFTRDFGPDVNLKNGESDTVIDLAAGDYSASETVPAGWDLLSFLCSNGDDASAITLGVGEDITCTAINTQQTGTITVVKVTDPNPDTTDTDFPFVSNFMGNFSLKNNEFKTSGSLTVNGSPYSVAETPVPAGWDNVSFTCDNGDDPSAITLTANDNVVCTATNVQQGTLIVKKVTDPAGSSQSFNFTRTYGSANFNLTDGQQDSVGNLAPGTYTATENVPVGWTLTNIACDDANSSGAGATATFELEAGETVTCTFTNTLQTGRIIVEKVTDPDTDTTTEFEFDTNYGPNFKLKNGDSDNSGPLSVLGSPYSVAEINIPAGWTLKSFTCDNGDDPSAITLTSGDVVTCTATNEQAGKVRVVKTFNGMPPSGTQSFTFSLRTGAAVGNEGTTLETKVANAANGGTIPFDTLLVSGDTYQLCEEGVPAGGHSSISDLPGAFSTGVSPADNSTQCVSFTVLPGETKTFEIDNTPPPGGDQRTIGYWKNWASCKTSAGKQAPKLDQTLYAATQAGNTIVIGTLPLPGGATADNAGTSCVYARNILDKTTRDGKKKMASDPLFNMAAQLLAAKLNVAAGAGTCAASTQAINDAQALLVKYGWNGLTYSPKLTAADAALANSLNTTLDKYNNGDLC